MNNNQQHGKWERLGNDQLRNIGMNGIRNCVRSLEDPEIFGVIKYQGNSDSGHAEKQFVNEVQSLERLDHPNIVKLLDYDLEAKRPYMVTELCRGGTLESTNLPEWTIEEKRICFHQICKAFAYLWEHGLTKSDHNFKNIFLKEDNTPVIGDFEYAREIPTNAEGVVKVLSQMGYTFWEIMEEKKFNVVWAREQRINERIDSLTGELEELKQQKADLLN